MHKPMLHAQLHCELYAISALTPPSINSRYGRHITALHSAVCYRLQCFQHVHNVFRSYENVTVQYWKARPSHFLTTIPQHIISQLVDL